MRIPPCPFSFRFAGCLAAFSLLATWVQAEPNPINFTDQSAGFKNGSLKGQSDWAVFVQPTYSGDFVFVSGTGVSLKQSASGAGFAYAFMFSKDLPAGKDTFQPGDAMTITADFFVVEARPDGGTGGGILGLGWGQYAPVGSNNMPFGADLTRAPGDAGYKLNFRTITKGQVGGDTSIAIPSAALGIDSGANHPTSDPLQLSFTLTQTDGERKEWSSVAILTNLKTKKSVVLKNSVTGVTTVYSTENLVRAYVDERTAASDDHLSSVIITKIDQDPAVDPLAQ
ncbi:hypothetical protein BH09VER1_BH09VER1_27810 [soil metagenome]